MAQSNQCEEDLNSETVQSLRYKKKALVATVEKLNNYKKLCATQTSDGFSSETNKWREVCIEILNELFQHEKSVKPDITFSDFMQTATSETGLQLLKFDAESGSFSD